MAAAGALVFDILHGDGAGRFTCEQTVPTGESTAPDLLAVGDVNGDGRPDLVVGATDRVVVHRQP